MCCIPKDYIYKRITPEDKEIEQIFHKVNIKEGSFSLDEYKKARAEQKPSKLWGPIKALKSALEQEMGIVIFRVSEI